MQIGTWILLAVYLAGILVIAYFGSRRTRSMEDYFLASRTLGPVVLGLSFLATWLHITFVMGAPTLAFLAGYGAWPIVPLNIIISIVLCFWILALPLRKMSGRLESITLPDFFQRRFESNGMSLASSIIIIVALFTYLAAIYVGVATAAEALLGVPYIWGLVLATLLVILYTSLGGFFGVCWTDFAQGIIVFIGLVAVFILSFRHIGGFQGLHQSLLEINPRLVQWPLEGGFEGIFSIPFGLILAFGFLSAFSSWAETPAIMRFFALRSVRDMKKMILVVLFFVTVFLVTDVFIGMTGRTMFDLESVGNPDLILPLTMQRVAPLWLASFFLVALVASGMGAIDSYLLVLTSSITNDIYRDFIKKEASPRSLLILSRTVTVLIGLGVFAVVMNRPTTLLSFLAASMGMLMSSLVPPLVFGLHWRKGTGAAGLAAMVAGFVSFILFSAFLFGWGTIESTMSAGPATAINIMVFLGVSTFTKKPSGELIRRAFAGKT
jgi:SSS family transporter